MPLSHHPLVKEFPNDHDRIHALKMENNHFHNLMEKYEEIDKAVYRAESEEEPTTDNHLNQMRKERLKLKDELYAMMMK